MKRMIYSLDRAIRTVERLSRRIDAEKRIEAIVSINRGGMVPGRYFSRFLRVQRVYALGMESYDGVERGNITIYQDLPPDIQSFRTILLVDDIVDSGSSLNMAVEHILERGVKKVVTCCLHRKKHHSDIPDYCGGDVEDDVWVVYDWE